MFQKTFILLFNFLTCTFCIQIYDLYFGGEVPDCKVTKTKNGCVCTALNNVPMRSVTIIVDDEYCELDYVYNFFREKNITLTHEQILKRKLILESIKKQEKKKLLNKIETTMKSQNNNHPKETASVKKTSLTGQILPQTHLATEKSDKNKNYATIFSKNFTVDQKSLTEKNNQIAQNIAKRFRRGNVAGKEEKSQNVKDPVREKAQKNYAAVVTELKNKFKGLRKNCFPRPKGCMCTVGKDVLGHDITERRLKDEDCKCKINERSKDCPAPGA